MQHALDMFYPEAALFLLSAACLMAAWVRGARLSGGFGIGRAGLLLSGWLVLFSLRADYGNIGTYIAFALLVGTWALGRAVPRRVLWGLLLLILPYHLWYGCGDLFSGIPGRLDGWSANPNIFADTLLPLVGIAGGVALFFRGIRRWAALVLCFIGLGFLVLTGSRAAIVGLIVSALLLFYLRVLRRYMASASVRQKTVAAVTAVVLGAGLFYGLFLLRPGSVMGRLLIYRITAASLVQHPSGNGLVSFSHRYLPDQAAYFERHPDSPFSLYAADTHACFNELLQTGYELGWAGIALFILTLWYLFTLKTPGSRGLLILKVSLAGMLVASMFSYPLRSLPSAGEYAVFFALFISYDRNRLFALPGRKALRIVATLPALCLFVWGCLYLGRRYHAYRQFDAVCTGSVSDYQDILDTYRTCYPILRNEGLFLRSYAQDLSFLGECRHSNNIYEQAVLLYLDHRMLLAMGENYECDEDYAMAEEYYMRAHYTVPSRFRPLYKLMLLHRTLGNITQAEIYARQILDKRVKVPSRQLNRMRAEAAALLNGPTTGDSP